MLSATKVLQTQLQEAKKAYEHEQYDEAFIRFTYLVTQFRECEFVLWLGKTQLKRGVTAQAEKCFKEVISRTKELALKVEAQRILSEIEQQKLYNSAINAESNLIPSSTKNKVQKYKLDETKKQDISEQNKYVNLNIKSNNQNLNKLDKRLRGLKLKTKVILITVVLGVTPVIAIGFTTYCLANRLISEKIRLEKEAKVIAITDKINHFLLERYTNIETFASTPAFRDPQIAKYYTFQQKQELLNKVMHDYSVYDSIAIFNTKGDLVVQTSGKRLDNYSDRPFFQKVIDTGIPTISNPEISRSSRDLVLEFAAPIQDRFRERTVGVVISRVPVRVVEDLIQNFGIGGDQIYLVDDKGKIFISEQRQFLRQDVATIFPSFNKYKTSNQVQFDVETQHIADRGKESIAYASFSKLEQLPQQNWSALLVTPIEIAFASQNQLILTLVFGIGLTTLVVGIIAIILAERSTSPILRAVEALKDLEEGKLEARVSVEGEDELAVLGKSINFVASQLQSTLTQIQIEHSNAKEAKLKAQQLQKQVVVTVQEQRKQRELIQSQLLELEIIFSRAAQGDLSVYAQVNDNDSGISAVAKYFNYTMESLREIVVQVIKATSEVSILVAKDSEATYNLAQEGSNEFIEIGNTTKKIQQLSQLIEDIAIHINQVVSVSQTVVDVVEESKNLANLTTKSVFSLEETINQAKDKIDRIVSFTQKISDTLVIILDTSTHINLLVVNSSLQANNIRKESYTEIEVIEKATYLTNRVSDLVEEMKQLVQNIKLEALGVIDTINLRTDQIVQSTPLADDTKNNLQKVTQLTQEVDESIDYISKDIVSCREVSQIINQAMQQIEARLKSRANSSEKISYALQHTLEVAQKLQTAVGLFYIGKL